MKQIFAIALALTLTPPAQAQDEQADLLCTNLMPPLLQLVSNIQGIPDVYKGLHQDLNAANKARFGSVKETGEALAEAAVAYRAAFLAACYGE